jgi:RNA polymerase Rpb1, domain 1
VQRASAGSAAAAKLSELCHSPGPMDPRNLHGALGLHLPLNHIALAPLDLEILRARAPGVVRSLVMYERQTLLPAPGGLFDEAIFGPSASLEARPAKEDAAVTRERSTRFGRIVLTEGVPHPLLPEDAIAELPVLPPDLRPMLRRDGEIVMSDVNEHYRQVLVWDGRLRRLREVGAPLALVNEASTALARAVAALVDNERQPEPSTDAAGRALVSLRGLLRPDADRALAALDEAAGRGADLAGPLPLALHRSVAALFTMGLVIKPALRSE